MNFFLIASKHVKAEQCRNRKPSSLCIKMIKRDKDICLINRQFMSDNCKLTCRFCSPYNKGRPFQLLAFKLRNSI